MSPVSFLAIDALARTITPAYTAPSKSIVDRQRRRSGTEYVTCV
jgi:hypothetical protein